MNIRCLETPSLGILPVHRPKIPGRDLPDDYVPQPYEKENVKFEDYATIIDTGWYRFAEEDLIYRASGLDPQNSGNQPGHRYRHRAIRKGIYRPGCLHRDDR